MANNCQVNHRQLQWRSSPAVANYWQPLPIIIKSRPPFESNHPSKPTTHVPIPSRHNKLPSPNVRFDRSRHCQSSSQIDRPSTQSQSFMYQSPPVTIKSLFPISLSTAFTAPCTLPFSPKIEFSKTNPDKMQERMKSDPKSRLSPQPFKLKHLNLKKH